MNRRIVIGLAVLFFGLLMVQGLWTGVGGVLCGDFGGHCIGRALLALPVVLIPAAIFLLSGAAVARAAAEHSAIWTVLGVIVALAAVAAVVPAVWLASGTLGR